MGIGGRAVYVILTDVLAVMIGLLMRWYRGVTPGSKSFKICEMKISLT